MAEERIRYTCTNCKYKFTRNKELTISCCPYCGTSGSIKICEGNDASKLLEGI